jgi:DNA repair protein RadA/Sms
MAKAKTNYTCSECGGIAASGPASARLRQWNTLVETTIETGGNNRYSNSQPQGLAQARR